MKKYAGGGKTPNPYIKQTQRGIAKPEDMRGKLATPVIPDPVKYPSYIGEVGEIGESGVSGPRMRKGGKVKSSASKRADGCAVKGKTRGKFV